MSEVLNETVQTNNEVKKPENNLEVLAKTAQLLDNIKTGKEMKEKTRNQLKSVIKEEEFLDKINAAVEGKTEDEINKLSLEELNEMLCITDEHDTMGIKFESVEEEINFKKGFLVYCATTLEHNKKIDAAMDQYEKDLQEFNVEFDELMKSTNDMSGFLIAELEKNLANATDETQKAKIVTSIAAIEDSFELERIYNTFKDLKPNNTLNDYFNRSEEVYKKYQSVIKPLNISTDITKLAGLEKAILPEKYHVYQNLFLFLVIKHYAYKSSIVKANDGVFLTQLLVNVKGLLLGNLPEAKKEKLIANVTRVLDLFY